jgi:hypothetical protein
MFNQVPYLYAGPQLVTGIKDMLFWLQMSTLSHPPLLNTRLLLWWMVLHTEDPLELRLKLIKANTKALIQSIHCVISYASCLIVSMPYGLLLLL